MQPERINIWRLSLIFVFSAAIPLLIGLGVDILFPSSLSMLMVAGIVSIPIVAFVVSRSVLAEMERVIQAVAPSEPTGDGHTGEKPVVLDQLHPEEADRSPV
ncbi:MAG: hypothetical protein DWI57_08165 [Chloroflexi bacterium]|nr:MAG: hypothetical protein DWI57_08165 [Chloroflexota bacterium]